MNNNSRFITNTRTIIHPKNYPECKEMVTQLSRQIFLAPCYAPDGSELTKLCYAPVVSEKDLDTVSMGSRPLSPSQTN